MANITVLNEVVAPQGGGWSLCFQWCEYHYDDDDMELGYRFIWRRPDGSLQAARGQARIPSGTELFRLIQMATEAGWFINAEN